MNVKVIEEKKENEKNNKTNKKHFKKTNFEELVERTYYKQNKKRKPKLLSNKTENKNQFQPQINERSKMITVKVRILHCQNGCPLKNWPLINSMVKKVILNKFSVYRKYYL